VNDRDRKLARIVARVRLKYSIKTR